MILASQERINEYGEKGFWGDKTLLDYFDQHVKENPDQICLVDPLNRHDLTGTPPERLTYQELSRAVDGVATALIRLGINKDDIIMVQLPNTWELAMLYLAITRAGGLITPLPMQWRTKELEYVATITEAKAVITVEEFKGFGHKELSSQLKYQVQHILTLEEIREFSQREPEEKLLAGVEVDANDIFSLCWTSGTEAEPKGCPLSHNNWIYLQSWAADAAGIRKGDVQLTAGPLVNMASIGTTFVPWIILGGTFVLHHPFDPQTFMQQMIAEKVNYTLLVPAIANMIIKHPEVDHFDLSAIRSITLGSAPPSLFTIQEFKRRWHIEIGNIWGQNEGTGIVSGPMDIPDLAKRVDHLPQYGKKGVRWAISVEGIETKLVDPETGLVVTEVGGVGELAYKSPSVISGYFRRPDLTEKSFDSEGYFYTGDLFQVQEDNCIGFFERKKDIIIRGGFNISSQELENILLGHPKIADIAAIGIPDEVLGERTCICIVPKPGEQPELEELKNFMKEQGVAVYKLPEKMIIMESIPRNPTGKVLKTVLREKLASDF